MTSPNTLERMADAIATAYGDHFARKAELGASFDPAGAAAKAALAELKTIDDSTVEAMARKLHTYDWNDICHWPDETAEVQGQYRERATYALNGALDHILNQGAEG